MYVGWYEHSLHKTAILCHFIIYYLHLSLTFSLAIPGQCQRLPFLFYPFLNTVSIMNQHDRNLNRPTSNPKALNSLRPSYLKDCISLYEPAHSLRSSGGLFLSPTTFKHMLGGDLGEGLFCCCSQTGRPSHRKPGWPHLCFLFRQAFPQSLAVGVWEGFPSWIGVLCCFYMYFSTNFIHCF